MNQTERRTHRSNIPSEATRLFCESMAKQLNARTLVLANEDGLTVSGAGTTEELDELAALAVIDPSRMNSLARSGEPTYAVPLDFGQTQLVLATLGGQAPTAEEARAAFGRILFRAA